MKSRGESKERKKRIESSVILFNPILLKNSLDNLRTSNLRKRPIFDYDPLLSATYPQIPKKALS